MHNANNMKSQLRSSLLESEDVEVNEIDSLNLPERRKIVLIKYRGMYTRN
jgi:hypothetical protein